MNKTVKVNHPNASISSTASHSLAAQIVEARKRALFQWLRTLNNPVAIGLQVETLRSKTLFINPGMPMRMVSSEEMEAEIMFNHWLLQFCSDIEELFKFYNQRGIAIGRVKQMQAAQFPQPPSLQCTDIPFDIIDTFLNFWGNAFATVVVERERVIIQQVPSLFGVVNGKFFCQTAHKPLAIAFHRLLESGIDSSITSPLTWIKKLESFLDISGEISSLRTEAKKLHLRKAMEDGENPELNEALRRFVEENYSAITAASQQTKTKRKAKSKKISPA
jgi:hypothetical protein